MTQKIHPLYGELITDQSMAQAQALPAGVYEGFNPGTATGTGPITVTLTTGGRGVSRFLTDGPPTVGRFIIEEDQTISFNLDVPGANPRIDLLVAKWKWAAGPLDPVTLLPTGVYTGAQQATYEVVQGTPAASPTAPAVSNPDGSGYYRVILAQVLVPVSGAPTISRWVNSDFRLDAKIPEAAATTKEVGDARTTYPTLKARIDDLGQLNLEMVSFKGLSQATGGATFADVKGFAETQKVGTAIAAPDSNGRFYVTKPGLYECMVTYGGAGYTGNTVGGMRLWMHYKDASLTPYDVQIDGFEDTGADETTMILYKTPMVDASWTDVYFHITRAGNFSGYVRGKFQLLGSPSTVLALGISNGNITATSNGASQTYPDSITVNLAAINPIGAVTWAVVAGGGRLDGTTNPKAEIVNGNQLKLTWTANPGALPLTWNLRLQATDSAATPRTVTKDLTVTLQAPAAFTVTTPDQTFNWYGGSTNISFGQTRTGGTTPITWEITATSGLGGASATIDSGTGVVSCTLTSGQSSLAVTTPPTITVKGTDAGAVQSSKVVTITINDQYNGPGGGCFTKDTWVLTPDGPKLLWDIKPGDKILAPTAATWEGGSWEMEAQDVEDVHIHNDREYTVGRLFGLGITPEHPAATLPNGFTPAGMLSFWMRIARWLDGVVIHEEAHAISFTEPAEEVRNLQTSGRAFLVSATPMGPWTLVHNMKGILTPYE